MVRPFALPAYAATRTSPCHGDATVFGQRIAAQISVPFGSTGALYAGALNVAADGSAGAPYAGDGFGAGVLVSVNVTDSP